MLLSVNEMIAHYGKAVALKGIALKVQEKQIITLIGANGAGKSTILRCISGLKALSSGEILFKGNRIDGLLLDKIVRLGIAHVPEGRRVFSTMTVLENLELGAYTRKDKKGVQNDLNWIYGLFPTLRSKLRQPAGSLSGGEQQMVATSRALMTRPELLLMDEPSLGLAPLLVATVGNMITQINQNGISVILVEQNARMALRISHYGYVLEVGKIIMDDISESLITNPDVNKAYLGG